MENAFCLLSLLGKRLPTKPTSAGPKIGVRAFLLPEERKEGSVLRGLLLISRRRDAVIHFEALGEIELVLIPHRLGDLINREGMAA